MSKFRSKFESHVAQVFRRRKAKFKYEPYRLPFTQPAIKRHYTPDFELLDTGVIVECKGKLTSEDRKKLLWVKETYPDLPIVILFMRARNTIRKGSKTTYASWATENGFDWADWEDGIPEKWTKKT